MKTLLLGQNTGFWHAAERAYERDIITGIEAWVFAFDGDHCNTLEATPELIERYDLIIGNTNGGLCPAKLLSLQEKRSKHIQWVSLIEGCATDYLAPDFTFKQLLDGSDFVNVINRHSLPFFRSLTTSRCEAVGIPYPAATIRNQFATGTRRDVWTPSNMYNPRASDASVVAALSVTERNGTKTHKAVRSGGTTRRWKFLGDRSDQQKEMTLQTAWLLKPVVLHSEMNMQPYFQLLSETAFAFVNLDHRYTWARDVLDCAALQIPCIATRATGHAADYFPELMVENEFAVDKASELLSRLYNDTEFYNCCSHVDIALLEHLSPESMKRKLLAALS